MKKNIKTEYETPNVEVICSVADDLLCQSAGGPSAGIDDLQDGTFEW